jgi:hypothetical protein
MAFRIEVWGPQRRSISGREIGARGDSWAANAMTGSNLDRRSLFLVLLYICYGGVYVWSGPTLYPETGVAYKS